ncbi:unnamed protein product [Rotaria sordida]|uniref:Uncharacterized protein n=1 Tax=Rotaria sordida TaxID=392033 RepID=A0A819VSC2_9BILA|nr:unnamed protein product [Rotaria sordida]
MLRVIQFVRSEKYGIKIPLNNVNDRLCAMLGVSSRSIDNLKKELKEIETSQEESSRRRLRSGSSTCTTDETMEQPEPVSGRPKINLSDFAKKFDIEILRLPVRHCILNPIEMCWAELKNSVQNQNTTFQLKDVEKLVWNWLYNCDSTFISSCIDHVHVYEKNFKKADQFIEEIEDELNDDDDNIDNDSDLTGDEDEDQ